MIRDMLRKAAERPGSETAATELDQPLEDANLGTPSESAMDSDPSESAEVSADDGAEDKTEPSAPVEAYESSATSQRTRTLPNGLTVTVHPTDEITTSLGDALPTIVSAGECVLLIFCCTSYLCVLLLTIHHRRFLL